MYFYFPQLWLMSYSGLQYKISSLCVLSVNIFAIFFVVFVVSNSFDCLHFHPYNLSIYLSINVAVSLNIQGQVPELLKILSHIVLLISGELSISSYFSIFNCM